MAKVREDLASREKNGASDLRTGHYPKISNEMMRDLAEHEGFVFLGLGGPIMSFRRPVPTDGDPVEVPGAWKGPIEPHGDIGSGKHRRLLREWLDGASADDSSLTLRRDQLGALPKAEILESAAEYGWSFESEEITDTEWRLTFRPGADAQEQDERWLLADDG
ncbi:hypothetical protein CDG81_02155 [Actinopolyspora erythraea]|uniref:Uncharacterized protein n=1 Tax=Actinopolyspora erythraea TaxID=414996 RepID=A0A099D1X2_9ACTN|nr:hypothetical protein [Actinopolyspora erythraea]ASU77313.1 hypothetical protein CDG81_02155 [Actinopolyspora erythraea]KGI80198.1 hypothetical protein IL38_18820 [Actinopolyspora erythraea]